VSRSYINAEAEAAATAAAASEAAEAGAAEPEEEDEEAFGAPPTLADPPPSNSAAVVRWVEGQGERCACNDGKTWRYGNAAAPGIDYCEHHRHCAANRAARPARATQQQQRQRQRQRQQHTPGGGGAIDGQAAAKTPVVKEVPKEKAAAAAAAPAAAPAVAPAAAAAPAVVAAATPLSSCPKRTQNDEPKDWYKSVTNDNAVMEDADAAPAADGDEDMSVTDPGAADCFTDDDRWSAGDGGNTPSPDRSLSLGDDGDDFLTNPDSEAVSVDALVAQITPEVRNPPPFARTEEEYEAEEEEEAAAAAAEVGAEVGAEAGAAGAGASLENHQQQMIGASQMASSTQAGPLVGKLHSRLNPVDPWRLEPPGSVTLNR
jgi:hypothetical protein